MTDHHDAPRVASASREIAASTERIFELIADPALQPRWDGNGNLAEAAAGQRIRKVGEVFTMTLTGDGAVRENHVVEFEEGRRIAWRPAEPGQRPPMPSSRPRSIGSPRWPRNDPPTGPAWQRLTPSAYPEVNPLWNDKTI